MTHDTDTTETLPVSITEMIDRYDHLNDLLPSHSQDRELIRCALKLHDMLTTMQVERRAWLVENLCISRPYNPYEQEILDAWHAYLFRQPFIPFDTEDPDAFGEQLRRFCFLEEYGCYSCFELQEGFQNIAPPDWVLAEMMSPYYPEEWSSKEAWEEEKTRIHCHHWPEKDILVAWLWDGDGILIVSTGGHTAVNTDCKIAHNWKWIDGPPA